jgi:hypothetical protein
MLSNIGTGDRFNIYIRGQKRWEYVTWRRTRKTAERYARIIGSPDHVMLGQVVAGRLVKTEVVDETCGRYVAGSQGRGCTLPPGHNGGHSA